jgi:hypothetical protein
MAMAISPAPGKPKGEEENKNAIEIIHNILRHFVTSEIS